jgi:hypothetical protein
MSPSRLALKMTGEPARAPTGGAASTSSAVTRVSPNRRPGMAGWSIRGTAPSSHRCPAAGITLGGFRTVVPFRLGRATDGMATGRRIGPQGPIDSCVAARAADGSVQSSAGMPSGSAWTEIRMRCGPGSYGRAGLQPNVGNRTRAQGGAKAARRFSGVFPRRPGRGRPVGLSGLAQSRKSQTHRP